MRAIFILADSKGRDGAFAGLGRTLWEYPSQHQEQPETTFGVYLGVLRDGAQQETVVVEVYVRNRNGARSTPLPWLIMKDTLAFQGADIINHSFTMPFTMPPGHYEFYVLLDGREVWAWPLQVAMPRIGPTLKR